MSPTGTGINHLEWIVGLDYQWQRRNSHVDSGNATVEPCGGPAAPDPKVYSLPKTGDKCTCITFTMNYNSQHRSYFRTTFRHSSILANAC